MARRIIVRNDRFDRANALEATNNGKTRSRDLCVGAGRGGERERTERVFRDIHGAEYKPPPDFVLVRRGNAAGDDDVHGDTGLWFVPTAEVLGKGQWSATVYRRGTNWVQGYTNVADFAGTFAYGVGDRAEVFGSFLVDTRIDATIRPIFVNDSGVRRLHRSIPEGQSVTGPANNVGDLYVGAKFNILSESRGNPAALALRGMIKLPTGKVDAGDQHRKADFSIDWRPEQGSREARRGLGLRRLRMARQRGWVRCGLAARSVGPGLTFPSRNFLRVVGELKLATCLQATWRPPRPRSPAWI